MWHVTPRWCGRVAVIGACGAVGRTTALLLRLSPLVGDLRLVDVTADSGVKGVAEDLSHIETLPRPARHRSSEHSSSAGKDDVVLPRTFKRVTGYGLEDIDAALADVDVVLSAAGWGRQKGMKTFDRLFEKNAAVAMEVAKAFAAHAPSTAWFAVATSPLNCIMPVTAETLKAAGAYHQERLFGMTLVSTSRARSYYARHTGEVPSEEDLIVIGGQTGATIVPLFSRATSSSTSSSEGKTRDAAARTRSTSLRGVPFPPSCPLHTGEEAEPHFPPVDIVYESLLSPGETALPSGIALNVAEMLTIQVSHAGASVTQFGQPSSLACAKAATTFVETALELLLAEPTVAPLTRTTTAMVDSALFPTCPYFSSPIELDRSGVKRVLPLPRLSAYEEELLDRCLPDLETNIHRGLHYYEQVTGKNVRK